MRANLLSFLVLGSLISALIFIFSVYKTVVAPTSAGVLIEKKSPSSAAVDDKSVAKVEVEPLVKSMLFLGDILLARNVEYLMTEKGLNYSFESISPTLNSFEIVIGNFESAMSDPHSRTPSFVMRFSTPTTSLPTLVSSGVTHVSLANNHAYDFGPAGYINAKEKLAAAPLITFGHPNTLSLEDSVTFIDVNNSRVALVAIHAVFSVPYQNEVKALFNTLRDTSDIQIVYIHWGDEYILSHNKTQENFARVLIASGADVIVGHHPHVTQDIGVIDGVPIFYSLGNFLFDQYFSTDVQQGYMLALAPTKSQIEFAIIPVTSLETRSKPRLMEGEEKTVFLEALASRSYKPFSEYILAGKGIFTVNLATSTQTSMISE